MATVQAGLPFIPTVSVGEAIDPTDITGDARSLGMTRWCRRSDGGWYAEICAYTAETAMEIGEACSLEGSITIAQNPTVLSIADAARTGEDDVVDDLIVIPQQTISAAGIYWFAFQGYVEALGGATIATGQHIEYLHDGTGEFIDEGTDIGGTAGPNVEAVGYTVDAAEDDTLSTIFLFGRVGAIHTV